MAVDAFAKQVSSASIECMMGTFQLIMVALLIIALVVIVVLSFWLFRVLDAWKKRNLAEAERRSRPSDEHDG
ncbi:hypothetical protein [Microbacterium indicum]|uniref:hypothetical protein n=1 Tax=Microbacterium indicum TaxID=358100 RepID=UPI00048E547A|nr:hypothetical protein [Microbacterium indicum]